MRRIAIILILALLLSCLSGCQAQQKIHSVTYFTLFDTVTTISGAAAPEEFEEAAGKLYDSLLYYHQLFDIYHSYPDINNLKTVNDHAGIKPVVVDPAIIALLQDCKEYAQLTHGAVNVAMGGVLKLWHDAREVSLNDPQQSYLPEASALQQAAQHTDLSCVIIDAQASTVYISDPRVQLDVGAVAKGWAVQQACKTAPSGLLVNVGGNIFATGPKNEKGTPWVIGVQDPDGAQQPLLTLNLTRGSVVTSGDYQRNFTFDGRVYHHIIDPQSLQPAEYWRSVTVLCEDSATADLLSTALFLLPYEDGLRLLEQVDAQAMWIDPQGVQYESEGFAAAVQSE